MPVLDAEDGVRAAALWLRWMGYDDAVGISGHEAEGADVKGASVAARVAWVDLHEQRPSVKGEPRVAVRRRDLQRFLDAHLASGRALFFFSTSGFTRNALVLAEERGVACFDLAINGVISPVNGIATRTFTAALLRHAGHRWRDPAQPRYRWRTWVAWFTTAGVYMTVFTGTLLVMMIPGWSHDLRVTFAVCAVAAFGSIAALRWFRS